MASPLNDLDPKLLWKHFAKILTIPHCSGNEKALGDYVLSVAASLGLPGKRDKVGNVLVGKPATAGREGAVGRHPPGAPRHGLREELRQGPRLLRRTRSRLVRQGRLRAAPRARRSAPTTASAWPPAWPSWRTRRSSTARSSSSSRSTRRPASTGANKLQPGFLDEHASCSTSTARTRATLYVGCAGGPTRRWHLAARRAKRRGRDRTVYELHVHGPARRPLRASTSTRGAATPSSSWPASLGQAQAAAEFEVVGIEGGNKHNAIPREAVAVWPARAVQVADAWPRRSRWPSTRSRSSARRSSPA
ncbi:MAG: hypothetical protein MZV70_66745 [Desulfobacterales bacterium]|nr:hypothetical protein [Desulfobacterales bacterium]